MNSLPLLVTSVPTGLARTILVLGALLMAGALLAGLARRGFLSMVAIYVISGLALGNSGIGWLDFAPNSQFVSDLTVVALVIILFRDGLEADAQLLRSSWHLPARKLALTMPITAIVVALVGHWAVGLDWAEAFLRGALLAPTDPVLSSSVVTNPRVPAVIRNSLNLESGLNDGLALPAVLAMIAVVTSTSGFHLWSFLLRDLGGGLLTGLVVAFVAARLLPEDKKNGDLPKHLLSLYALGSALLAYGIAVLALNANGLIAVFVGAICLGLLRPDLVEAFAARADDIVEITKLTVFLVFGAAISLSAVFADGWGAVAVVAATFLVARPLGVAVALAGTKMNRASKAFMAWFGPKGVATMSFSLLVFSRVSGGERIANLAALCVLFSIVAHGLTDVPGVNWIASRAGDEDESALPEGAS
jgi:NhaP-type Na+/H+ or K+/H+ antiporter